MSNLYDVDVEDFKEILDDKMNYHYMEKGPLLLNKFDNYTYNILEYLDGAQSLLDVGCGFGGPARFIQSELDINVKGVSNIRSQVEHTSQYFPTYFRNAEEFSSNEKYDVAAFFDSLCHMDAKKVLANIAKYTDKILIKDYTFLDSDYYYSARWNMHFRSKSNWEWLLSKTGFKLKHFEVNDKVLVDETHQFWYNNLKKVKSKNKQIEMLKVITQQTQHKPGKAYCVLYAEKA